MYQFAEVVEGNSNATFANNGLFGSHMVIAQLKCRPCMQAANTKFHTFWL